MSWVADPASSFLPHLLVISITSTRDYSHSPYAHGNEKITASALQLEARIMKNVLILGAAGRDFHNFNVVFRNNSQYRVVAFTDTQIPDIANRQYPPELA